MTVTLMVLLLAVQSVASAAVSYTMAMNSATNTAMNASMSVSASISKVEDGASCHRSEKHAIEKHESERINSGTINSGPINAETSSIEQHSSGATGHDCCDTECQCSIGHCTSAALPIEFLSDGHLVSTSKVVYYPSNSAISQSFSSPYRPPITL